MGLVVSDCVSLGFLGGLGAFECRLLARLFHSWRAASTEAIEGRAAGMPGEVESFRC